MLFNTASLSSSITAPSQPLHVSHNDREEALKLSKQMVRQSCGLMMQTSYAQTFCYYQGISSQLLERDFLHSLAKEKQDTHLTLLYKCFFPPNRAFLVFNRNVLTEISFVFCLRGFSNLVL